MQQGVLESALDDQVGRDVLVDFFVNTLLPLKVTTNKIAELIGKELEKQLLIGGSESFQQLSAKNKIAFDSIANFLDKKFGVEWRPKDLGS